MAATFAINANSRRDLGETVTDMTCDGAYPAGGYPVVNSSIGMQSTPVAVDCDVATAQGLLAAWDSANNKIKLFVTGAGLSGVLAEAAAGNVSTAVVVRLKAKGAPMI